VSGQLHVPVALSWGKEHSVPIGYEFECLRAGLDAVEKSTPVAAAGPV